LTVGGTDPAVGHNVLIAHHADPAPVRPPRKADLSAVGVTRNGEGSRACG
jgi:hypothetical protein